MRIHVRYAFVGGTLFLAVIFFKVYLMTWTTVSRDDITSGLNTSDKVIVGNPLISEYGRNDARLAGELGRGVVLVSEEKTKAEWAMREYRVNVFASDIIPLNRLVPDSRPPSCKDMKYPYDLPTTSVVIPFHNEWPSILLRTIYSLINRTPKHILKQVILVDDASDLDTLKSNFDEYVKQHFPKGLVTIIRLPKRSGLIKARLRGFELVTSEVVSFFDSHMEVNLHWLEPLLVEIKKNRSTIAMAHLDYIKADTMQYDFEPGYKTRYGFDWRLIFFETYFRLDQQASKSEVDPLPGVVMVGPAFAVDVKYFKDIGTYDSGMEIWGGENIELAWRVWLCGGQLLHSPCAKVGHIARAQPYSFPAGRYQTEIHNYKRAVDVWMGPYKKYVYDYFPDMKNMDAGDISERLKIKSKLKCRTFDWYLKNVWPELFPYAENVFAWGGLENVETKYCLDNDEYLFQAPVKLIVKPCTFTLWLQGFSWTREFRLRTTLQCVVVLMEGMENIPYLQNCIEGPKDTWNHTPDGELRHQKTGLCLQLMAGPMLSMQACDKQKTSQQWRFKNYTATYRHLINKRQLHRGR
ncbi:inactive polypeptide N-acetylgalactosaminyltransferase-like protein 5 [Gigantopelta aegis]|uniref:inactive polypeptide N-acetylgalactosaminyltransferase-like protein 5 n=1 Tax=Gigantopelta aegis TaxID=1735272 RepID=UPI001B88B6C2|nr:inactive polypeptide N-acetylgalactosaminyltransferase-like protein 5 [Gigantopelta aegis]XP_041367913.1 inactive polypeptide N-acetylgalactosaminyltransferase-like protein 5 [Gigantopelta aegis]